MAKGRMYKTVFAIAGKMDGSLKKAFDKAQNLAKKTGTKIKSSLGKAVKIAGTTMVAGATAATVAIGGLGAVAVKNAAMLETQMQNVGTLLDGTATEVAARTSELSEDIIKVSNNTGIATADLTAGLYDVISAVGDSEDSVKILEIAAKAAAAGNATTAESVSLLTAVTKGYGDTSGEAFQKASDLAFQTVKLGQTTFPELAASIKQVTGTSSQLGVQQEELFGVFATLTGVTGGAAEVSTQFKNILAGLMQPSKEMAKALDSLGYKTGSAAIEALGFQGTLDALQETTKGNVQETAKLFGSMEAKTAVMALCSSQAENLTIKTNAMYEASGAASRAFDTQTASLEYTVQRMKNLGTNFLTSVGTKLLPIVADLANKLLPKMESALDAILPIVFCVIDELSPAFSGLSENIKRLFKIIQPQISKVVDCISPLIPTINGISVEIMNIAFGLRENTVNIGRTLSKIPGVLEKVIQVISKIGNQVKGLIENIMGLVMELIPMIMPILQQLAPLISNAISQILKLINSAVSKVREIAPVVMEVIQRLIAGGINLYNALAPVIQTLIEKISPVFTQIMPFIQQILGFVEAAIGLIGQLSPALTFVAGILGDIGAYIAGSFLSQLGWVVEHLTNIINVIREVVNVASYVIGWLTGEFQGSWNDFWNGLGGVVSGLAQSVKAAFGGLLTGVVNGINTIIGGINKMTSVAGIPQIPQIPVPAFAKGATVTSPTLALVGEGRDAETIVPHNSSPRSRALLQEAARGVYGAAGSEKKSTKTYNITYAPTIINGNGTIKEELDKDFERFKKFYQRQEDEFDREVLA